MERLYEIVIFRVYENSFGKIMIFYIIRYVQYSTVCTYCKEPVYKYISKLSNSYKILPEAKLVNLVNLQHCCTVILYYRLHLNLAEKQPYVLTSKKKTELSYLNYCQFNKNLIA